MINSEVIADSISSTGCRITTLKVVMPRMILAEFNTHRAFSRNSASSRAIPFKKMVRSVMENPFIPIAWQKDHKGMQGTEYLEFPATGYAEEKWLEARDKAVEIATYLNNTEGVTKQLVNRLLEPFMYHTVLVTSTEFDNWFELRDHEAAEIHIQALARTMKESMSSSTPKQLELGDWHIPYGDNIVNSELDKLFEVGKSPMNRLEARLQIATARCARLSYETLGTEPKIDYNSDLELFNRLILTKPMHASPAEHCAQAMNDSKFYKNFRGFKQYRQFLEETIK